MLASARMLSSNSDLFPWNELIMESLYRMSIVHTRLAESHFCQSS